MSDATDAPEQARPITGMIRRIIRGLRGLDGDETAEEVAETLREKEDRGEGIEDAQKDMILNAARFDELRVADVMTPRASVNAVEVSATLAEVSAFFAETQHSRLPIYRETLDDPLGFVHVKDVLALLAPGADGEVRSRLSDRVLPRIKREILFVPASMRLPNLLLKMQTSRIHLALVVDEYGGTDGLVSIEDLVEQIVGEIADEYDVPDDLMIQRSAVGFEVDARAAVDDLAEALGADLTLVDQEDEFDTVGGLAVALVGRVPQRGEVLRHPAGFDVEVLDADPRRVKRLRVKPSASPTPSTGTASP